MEVAQDPSATSVEGTANSVVTVVIGVDVDCVRG